MPPANCASRSRTPAAATRSRSEMTPQTATIVGRSDDDAVDAVRRHELRDGRERRVLRAGEDALVHRIAHGRPVEPDPTLGEPCDVHRNPFPFPSLSRKKPGRHRGLTASEADRIGAVENYQCASALGPDAPQGAGSDPRTVTPAAPTGKNAHVADVVDVILRDGSTLRLRPPARADADAILDFFRALSEQSLYMRFHGFPSLGPEVVEQVLDSDWAERGALLGSLVEDGSGARRRARELHAPARSLGRRERVRRGGRVPAPRSRNAPRRAAGRARRAPRDRAVRRARAAGQPQDARRLRGARLRAHAGARGRRGRDHVPDRAHRAIRGASRGTRPRRGDGLAPPVLRAAERRGDRRLAAAWDDRRRAVPERHRSRLRGCGIPGQPRRRLRRGRPRLSLGGRDPRPGRRGGDLRAGGERDRGGRAGARPRRPRTGRDLRGLRGDGQRRHRPPGAAARPRPRPRCAPDRAELPRHLRRGPEPQRHVRIALDAAREHRLLLAERRAGARAPRGSRDAGPRAVRVRLDREQGRRLDQRPARMVGGRHRDRGDPPLRRVVRKPAPVCADRPQGRPAQADPGAQEWPVEERPARRELPHGGARRLGRRRRCALPPGGGDPRRDAGGARRRRLAVRRRRAAGRSLGRDRDERRRARDPLRRRLRGGRPRAPPARRRHGDRPAGGASGRGERRESRRHARQRDGRHLCRRRAARARRPARLRMHRAVRARRQRHGRGDRRGGRRRPSTGSSPTSRCSR